MPLLLSKQINPYSAYAVWHITETEQQLSEKIEEVPRPSHPNRKSEWIVTRILVKYLTEIFDLTYQGVANLESGKPVLSGQRAEISISHSFPMAAVLINLRKPCGIDLELPREKLQIVRSKFLNDSENAETYDLIDLCKFWTAKEVLFKVYGDKALSFKNHMLIEMDEDWKATGLILKNSFEARYTIHFETLNKYLLAFSV